MSSSIVALLAGVALFASPTPAPTSAPTATAPKTPTAPAAVTRRAPSAPPQPSAAASQPASRPASRPAGMGGPGGRPEDLRASVIIAYRLGENELTVEEFWQINNPSGGNVNASDLTVSLPDGARVPALDESTSDFELSDDRTAILGRGPLMAGKATHIGARYFQRLAIDTAAVRRTFPFTVNALRIIVEHVPGITVTSAHPHEDRLSDMGGSKFAVFDFGALSAGETLAYAVSGVPAKTVWPRYLALFFATAFLAWMIYSLMQPGVRRGQPSAVEGPLSPRARKDQILRAVQILERERAEEKVTEKRHARRHAELMTELARVLREIEIAERHNAGHGVRSI